MTLINNTLFTFKKIFFISLIFISIQCIGQKKYPSLFWEITGNNLAKPSYLYGTMHVSNKLAYHLSDSFFVALTQVNIVGLETNPDQWLSNMKRLGLLETPNYSANNANFYKDAFKLNVPSNKQYAGILAYNPDLINGLLYRNNTYNQDHEEATYIDLFIYKAGSKLNKKIVSLEDFKTSMVMATKATTKDPDEVYDESTKNVDFRKVQTEINDAYRIGNLDALDSLDKLVSPSKNHQKYLLNDRNIILAHNIDSICKTNTLFAGIGAAHLAGEKGVIELLRKMGYKLRPILNNATKKGMKQRKNIEELVKKIPATKQVTKDSVFSYDLFETPVELANTKGFSFSLATDMANGAYYTISRQVTYAPLNNYTIPMMLAKIDSLLYENIPGKIISRKDFTTNTGIKGIDITNETKQGDLQRYHIYMLANECVIFKMAGKGNYINTTDGQRFFNSITFSAEKKSVVIPFSLKTKGFEVNLPTTNCVLINKKSGNQGLAEDVYAYKTTDNSSVGVMHYFYNDFDYLEEDTFELNILCNSTLKNFNYTTNITRQFTKQQQLPCIEFSAENSTLQKRMSAKIIIKGTHYYLVYAVVDKTLPTQVSTDFLNTFKLTDFKHIYSTPVITDHDFAFTVKDEEGDDITNAINKELEGFYKDIKKQEDSKKYNLDFDYQSLEKTYYSPSSAEHVNVYYEKYNDYDYRNPETYWADLKKYIEKTGSLNVTKFDVKKTDKLQVAYVVMKDTACTNIIKRSYILKDGLLFCLTTVCDSVNGTKGWTEDFLATFKHKDTLFTKPIFEIKISTLLKNLSSPDSSIKYAAKQSLQTNGWEKIYAKTLLDYYVNPEFKTLNEETRATLLVNGGTLNDEKIIPIYKNLYNYYADSSYMQICIIKGLGLLKTKNSYATIFDLLKNQTPLTGNEENITDVISPLYDSLELCINYFPGLFTLTSFEEYESPIKLLFADLVIRKLIPANKYLAQLPVLISEANNEIKRFNSNSKSNKSSIDDYDTETKEALDVILENELANAVPVKTGKKTYPLYNNMIENYAVVLAPHYLTNAGVKQYFDKLFKIKNEQILLNICLIANENKININDTLWSYLSNNTKTKLKLYNELNKIKQLQKFNKQQLSQVNFCKTFLEKTILSQSYNVDDETVKQKTKTDSIYFLRKELASNKYENGTMYFFNRVDAKTKATSLAIAYVNQTNEENITTNMINIDTKRVIEIATTIEETVNKVLAEFHYKFRYRYVNENQNANYDYVDY